VVSFQNSRRISDEIFWEPPNWPWITFGPHLGELGNFLQGIYQSSGQTFLKRGFTPIPLINTTRVFWGGPLLKKRVSRRFLAEKRMKPPCFPTHTRGGGGRERIYNFCVAPKYMKHTPEGGAQTTLAGEQRELL